MPSATRRLGRRRRPGVGAPCLPRSCLADRVRQRPQQRPAAHAQTRRASVRSQPGTLAVCLVRSHRLAYSQYTLSPIMSNREHGTAIIIRQVKYLNNIVEQDHRGVKRVTRPMLGFKSFEAAQGTLVGIELMHMIKKRQLVVGEGDEGRTAAELFYSLAA